MADSFGTLENTEDYDPELVPFKETPHGKGFRTAYQTVGGTIVAYFSGLLALPEVREYTTSFIHTQGYAALLIVLGAFGVSAGLISFLQNFRNR